MFHGDQQQTASPGERLVDLFSRSISYLRLSVTDQCNLRCLYCSPQDHEKLASAEIMSYEEILRVVEIAVGMGIKKVRLTGGEPLVRKGILDFIARLAAIPGLQDIRLTTNGTMLEEMAAGLYATGIRKINVSLDSLRPQRFASITGRDQFHRVWNGIQQALACGFSPLKINVVALRGVNDDEFVDLARLSLSLPVQVRFIEFMPVDSSSWEQGRYISSSEIMGRLSGLGELLPVNRQEMDGPARVYRLSAAGDRAGSLGFISAISHHFCDQCNRLRLTSEGRLRACLLSDKEIDVKKILRRGADDEELRRTILAAIAAKPQGHALRDRQDSGAGSDCHGRMSRIGG